MVARTLLHCYQAWSRNLSNPIGKRLFRQQRRPWFNSALTGKGWHNPLRRRCCLNQTLVVLVEVKQRLVWVDTVPVRIGRGFRPDPQVGLVGWQTNYLTIRFSLPLLHTRRMEALWFIRNREGRWRLCHLGLPKLANDILCHKRRNTQSTTKAGQQLSCILLVIHKPLPPCKVGI